MRNVFIESGSKKSNEYIFIKTVSSVPLESIFTELFMPIVKIISWKN